MVADILIASHMLEFDRILREEGEDAAVAWANRQVAALEGPQLDLVKEAVPSS